MSNGTDGALWADAEGDDDLFDEVEITFDPRTEVLARLGISLEDFEAALVIALEAREAQAETVAEGDLPPLEEMMLTIGGATYKVEDLAEVEIDTDDADETDEA